MTAVALALAAAGSAVAADAGGDSTDLSVSAYAAASYYHSTGYPGGPAAAGSDGAGFDVHQFDVQHDPSQIDEADLTLAYQPKQGLGALVDVIAGEDASILRQAEGGDDSSLDVRQAFAQYATGPVTVMLGKLLPCAGAEVINPTQDLNYSRSLLFTLSEPLTLTGARATYAPTDALTFNAGINGGWNVTTIGHGLRSGEAGASWSPSKTFSLSLQSNFAELMPGGPQRTLIDLVLSETLATDLTLLLSADWDQQSAANGAAGGTWYGAAGTVGYAFNARWRVAVRAEYLEDADGFLTGTSGGQHLAEATLTLGFKPSRRLELRAEWRADFAQFPVFLHQPAIDLYPYGTSPGRLTTQLGQFALQAVYTFYGS
ncbi:MAG TPA: outer membrane beta-barrel protein [Steroidobacteraceae bacterium]|nr:outer membrane beta-barrel protein [Steroidobacteraceae bacterium]